jgi:hypothetical protein
LVLGVDQFRIEAWDKCKREVEEDLTKVLDIIIKAEYSFCRKIKLFFAKCSLRFFSIVKF